MKKEKLQVLHVPNWSENNPYQHLLLKSLEKDCRVSLTDFPDGLTPFSDLVKKNPGVSVIHIHWITDLISRISWSKSFFIETRADMFRFDPG